ncbi:hypothetical protein CNMCM5878_003949 [Aspergillus fumigatiaffinis]|jgi:3-phytase|nr:hypothetical protein CNMCM5878_003949 [Aspergillus fumigatiaffinis]KAF4219163.1 hypothetical protein CNMCM6457_003225 [Aspergillus fumigatiaffinis]
MVDSGMKFYRRYESLLRKNIPFIRASGEGRVVASAEKFIDGFQRAKNKYTRAREHQASPVVNVGISGNNTYSNTLDDSICAAFETSNLADEIVANFTALVKSLIWNWLENYLPGIKLSDDEAVYLMDMCSFDTVARTENGSELSPFCALFVRKEWV